MTGTGPGRRLSQQPSLTPGELPRARGPPPPALRSARGHSQWDEVLVVLLFEEDACHPRAAMLMHPNCPHRCPGGDVLRQPVTTWVTPRPPVYRLPRAMIGRYSQRSLRTREDAAQRTATSHPAPRQDVTTARPGPGTERPERTSSHPHTTPRDGELRHSALF